MADPNGCPSLVPSLATYRNYFTRAETNTFCGHYADVIRTYKIDAENAAAATTPSEVA